MHGVAREGIRWRRIAVPVAVGAVLGVLLLHPATMAIYWLEFRAELTGHWASGPHFIAERMSSSFSLSMLPMTALFAALGGGFGSVYAVIDARSRKSERVISFLERTMARDVLSLIRDGESEHVELKSTARWDRRSGKVNKALSDAIARTIAAFANHDGGTLLIGVSDDGEAVGIEQDYRTLKSRDRDGFEQFLMSLVRERLGGHVCRLIHPVFTIVDGCDVCRVVVEPADEPVYLLRSGQSQFFTRTGNASRELDARELVMYVSARWGAAGNRQKVVSL